MFSYSFDPNGPHIELGLASHEERSLFLDTLPTNTNALFLHVQALNFNENEPEKIATALKVNTTLTSLSLSLVPFNPEHERAAVIFDALAVNFTLISFEASDFFDLPASVAQKIATLLEVNSTLKALKLCCCPLGNTNTISLAQTLSGNSTLESLELSHSQVSTEAALEMSKALSANRTLTAINLANNYLIGDAGASALIDMVIQNPSVTSLDISLTGWTDGSIPKIVELIRDATSLRTLDIRSNPDESLLVDTTLASIRDAILLNGTITAFYAIPPFLRFITNDSKAIDNACLRNEYNLGQKSVSLFELLRDHLIKIAPDENFPIPQKTEPVENFINPHRDSFV